MLVDWLTSYLPLVPLKLTWSSALRALSTCPQLLLTHSPPQSPPAIPHEQIGPKHQPTTTLFPFSWLIKPDHYSSKGSPPEHTVPWLSCSKMPPPPAQTTRIHWVHLSMCTQLSPPSALPSAELRPRESPPHSSQDLESQTKSPRITVTCRRKVRTVGKQAT